MAVTIEREQVHVKKGDMVEVIAGRQRGKRGKVLKVLPKHGKVIIEGVNVVKRHTKLTQKMPQGGVVEKEGPVDRKSTRLNSSHLHDALPISMAVPIEREQVHVKKGDMVEVIDGRQRGKRGMVLKVLPKHGKVIIEGVNVVKRHTIPTQKMPQGGVVEKEAPVYSSRVMMVCPKCGRAARVGHGYLADGAKVRVCKRCGEQSEK